MAYPNVDYGEGPMDTTYVQPGYGSPIDRAQAKWERKTANSGGKWKRNVSGKKHAYESGIARFIGVSPGQITTGGTWQREVSAVSAAEFNQSVQGKGGKWRANYIAGVTRGGY